MTHALENLTTTALEYILARLARIETQLIKHERRAAATLPPLCLEPNSPDGPPLYLAAQPPYPPYQPTSHCQNRSHVMNKKECLQRDSILGIETKEDIVPEVTNFDPGDLSSAAMGSPSDTHGTWESRDGIPNGQRVSAFEEIYLL